MSNKSNTPPTQPSEEKRKIIIELHPTRALMAAAGRGSSGNYAHKQPFDVAALFPDIDIDSSFPPTRVPSERDVRTTDQDAAQTQSLKPQTRQAATQVFNFIIRAEVDDNQLPELRDRPEVAGVFSDPLIHPITTCGYSLAVGTHLDVERLLCVPKLKRHGLNGSDVLVAVVDNGINLDYLNAHGKSPNFDRMRSWVPNASGTPGQFPVHHGTMCAFDVCIAAPRCTLLDIALLRSNLDGFSGILSDAVRAYEHLFSVMTGPLHLGESRSMVVTNSWAMFDRSGDLPVGDPGNYSDNINHPFNRSVTALEGAGADIVFAAGNCGIYCPDVRCSDIKKTIYGANSHPDVLCVGGVDITKALVGFSSRGPGCLTNKKPDVCGYTHFKGSEVYSVDSGTSAACPVVAGLVAAFRTRWQYDVNDPDTHPVALRHYVTSTAGHGMSLAYDYGRGRGVVRGCALVDAFYYDDSPPPRLIRTNLEDFCKQYPELCHQAKSGDKSSTYALPSDVFEMLRLIIGAVGQESDTSLADMEPILAAYLVGRIQSGQHIPASSSGGCGCGHSSKSL